MIIADCLKRAAELQETSDSARLDVELLLCHALAQPRSYLFTWPEKNLTAVQQQTFEALLQRRLEGEPVAHLLGEREFWTLSLSVNASTLIPRPETELLVERVLELLPATEQRLVDLGTGTGAIALALASERPAWQVYGLDKYPDAVALASHNRDRHRLENVQLLQSDWLAALADQEFHCIVSNPPYIDADDPHLQQGDVRFEPLTALVAGDQGLADIVTIVEQAWPRLYEQGYLLVEHGYQQGAAVRKIFAGRGFRDVQTLTDWGGHERVTLGCK